MHIFIIFIVKNDYISHFSTCYVEQTQLLVQQPKAIYLLIQFRLIKCFFLQIIYLLDVYNKIQVGVELLPWAIREIQDGDQRDCNQPI